MAVALLPGCGESGVPDRTDATAHYTSATQAFNNGQFPEALEHYNAALELGGMNPDQFVEMYIRRAVCRAKMGDAAGAHKDLDFIADGAAELDLVYSARAFVLRSEGKTGQAAAMLAKARAINRQVTEFGK